MPQWVHHFIVRVDTFIVAYWNWNSQWASFESKWKKFEGERELLTVRFQFNENFNGAFQIKLLSEDSAICEGLRREWHRSLFYVDSDNLKRISEAYVRQLFPVCSVKKVKRVVSVRLNGLLLQNFKAKQVCNMNAAILLTASAARRGSLLNWRHTI
jgi:hypothetical protein